MKPSFEELVREELKSAREKHGNIVSVHEGAAILFEEVSEAWDEVKKKTKERDMDNLLKELIQIGAMCQKMAEDVVIPFIKNNKK